MTHAHTLVVPLCLLAVGGAWFVLGRTSATPAPADAQKASASTSGDKAPVALQAPTTPAKAAASAAKTTPQAVFPDGSTWPLLNGVTEQVTMPWPDRPF